MHTWNFPPKKPTTHLHDISSGQKPYRYIRAHHRGPAYKYSFSPFSRESLFIPHCHAYIDRRKSWNSRWQKDRTHPRIPRHAQKRQTSNARTSAFVIGKLACEFRCRRANTHTQWRGGGGGGGGINRDLRWCPRNGRIIGERVCGIVKTRRLLWWRGTHRIECCRAIDVTGLSTRYLTSLTACIYS